MSEMGREQGISLCRTCRSAPRPTQVRLPGWSLQPLQINDLRLMFGSERKQGTRIACWTARRMKSPFGSPGEWTMWSVSTRRRSKKTKTRGLRLLRPAGTRPDPSALRLQGRGGRVARLRHRHAEGPRRLFRFQAHRPKCRCFAIEKNPRLARRQGAYCVTNATGQVLKRGHELANVLRVFDKRPRLATL